MSARASGALVAAGCVVIVMATACSAGPAPRANDTAAAIRLALPPLQHTMAQWFEERTCTSCHHHSLGVMALAFVRERGFAVDEPQLQEMVDRLSNSPDGTIAALQGRGAINPASGRGFQLAALAAAQHPADERTDAMVHLLAGLHRNDGAWLSESHRPPLEDSAVTTTALCCLALRNYGPGGRSAEFAERVAGARTWLERQQPSTNEDRTMRLLGLHWCGAAPATIEAAMRDLLAMQRGDGSWAQLDGDAGDAYATGQALVALQRAGLPTDDGAYRRGAQWLLDRQLADGTWIVHTRRRHEGLEQFDSGFPHGIHQFLSVAASCWAVMALAAEIAPAPSTVLAVAPPPRDAATAPRLPALLAAAAFGTHADLQRLLDGGADPDMAGPGGLTALMLAVHDPQKVTTLLARGARVDARSELQNTALILAGRASPLATTELLLASRADANAQDEEGTTALTQAVLTGDIPKVRRLLAAGVSLKQRTTEGIGMIHFPCWSGDTAMLRFLIEAGADPAESFEGSPLLVLASTDGLAEIVRLLLAAGAPVDAPDEDGLTALAWAARTRWGNAEIAAALLAAGADPDRAAKDGQTPRSLAQLEDNRPVLELFAATTAPR
ncbi:MAG: ankyrin repeat domain-containing protein [Planctomycetes bacterium]|nr:ankyrin repeat domain-containing protein [Planctomycetota bacterium]